MPENMMEPLHWLLLLAKLIVDMVVVVAIDDFLFKCEKIIIKGRV